MLKKSLYVLGGLAILAGFYGVFQRLTTGHQAANYGSIVVWGLWVAMYLFFAGVAAGSFMVASLDLLFNIRIFKGVGRMALWAALVSLAAALLSIWMDLGHLDRVWKVYLQGNPGSIMFQMVWGYTLFGLVALAALVQSIRKPGSLGLKATMIAGFVLSIFVAGAVGALIGVQAARPLWHAGLYPVQFPVISLATGVALMLALIGLFGPREDPNRPQQLLVLGLASAVLVVVKFYFLWADASQTLYAGEATAAEAVRQMLSGPYWWVFWIVEIGVGSLIPLAILVQPKLAKNGNLAGWMGILLLVGYGIHRGLVVFPALTVPELAGLAEAFNGPHLSLSYFPSLVEWALALGLVGFATVMTLLGSDRLPLFKRGQEV